MGKEDEYSLQIGRRRYRASKRHLTIHFCVLHCFLHFVMICSGLLFRVVQAGQGGKVGLSALRYRHVKLDGTPGIHVLLLSAWIYACDALGPWLSLIPCASNQTRPPDFGARHRTSWWKYHGWRGEGLGWSYVIAAGPRWTCISVH